MCKESSQTTKRNNFDVVKEIIFYALGVILISGFILLYWTRFVNIPVLPPSIRNLYFEWGKDWACIVNAGVFILFVLFIPYRTRIEWRSKGVFSAFILALFAEMFGIPFLFYILSPFLGYNIPVITLPGLPPFQITRHFFIAGWPGVFMGSWMTLVGMGLVFAGWSQIHKAEELVTTGLYKYIRHPQYTGMFLIIIGWVFHWATFVTVLMFPVLLVMYYKLARREEKELLQQYKDEYQIYCQNTSMFLPLKWRKK